MRKNYFAELRAVLLISAALLQGVSLYANTGDAVAETKGAAAGEVAQKKTTVKGVVTDDKGADWVFYHAVSVANPEGRVLMLDRVNWKKGWPVVEGDTPSLQAKAPVIRHK